MTTTRMFLFMEGLNTCKVSTSDALIEGIVQNEKKRKKRAKIFTKELLILKIYLTDLAIVIV